MADSQRADTTLLQAETQPAALTPQEFEHAVVERLVATNLLPADRVTAYRQDARKASRGLLEHLQLERVIREEDIVRTKAAVLHVPYIDVFGRIVRGEILNLIAQEVAENYQMVAFSQVGNEVSVAMVDPTDFKALEAIEFIARKNRLQIRYSMVSDSGLKYILRQYESLSAEVEEALKSAESEAVQFTAEHPTGEEHGVEEVIRRAPVSKMVSVILRHAVEGKASDVHIEPVGDESRVRYRVDGVLHTSIILPRHIHSSVVARIKVLASLKIDETRIPQDGRFHMTIEDREIDYRVSILPLFNQEKVVMRILDTAEGVSNLGQLGFEGRNLAAVEVAIRRPHGMILMTGPTGSGKSTSLYAMLSILNQERVNIVTLEDPIEYYLKGVNQSQIYPDAGYTFANGLRAILRQDPDIIMVGEIRDSETAQLAIHAALTGHLILTTLHTNDSFGAIPRLIDMGLEPFLISASLNVVLAQRLVRRVCLHCKTAMTLPASVEKEVRDALADLPEGVAPEGLDIRAKNLPFFRGTGCARCENTGYKGRLAIIEVFQVNPDAQKIMVDGGDIIGKFKEAATRQHMYSMQQDGILKALRGLTTIEEIFAVTRE